MSDEQLITVNLDKDLLFELAMQAHAENMTLNEYINNALREYMNMNECNHTCEIGANEPCDTETCHFSDVIPRHNEIIYADELTDYELEEVYIESIVSVYRNPTHENLQNVAHAYTDWFNHYAGDMCVTDIYNEAVKRLK
jgi:hypothetical protein